MEHPFFITNPNRAEALRCLAIAEKLLVNRDLMGSKSFATRAQESDPTLVQIEQINAIIDTLLAGDKVINNQLDWYGILQVPPEQTHDSELIANQYRRLSLLLNPQKNGFPFSEQAFRLVVDAWSLLSNPFRKSLYDKELGFFINLNPNPNQGPNTVVSGPIHQHLHHQHQHHQQQSSAFSVVPNSGRDQQQVQQQVQQQMFFVTRDHQQPLTFFGREPVQTMSLSEQAQAQPFFRDLQPPVTSMNVEHLQPTVTTMPPSSSREPQLFSFGQSSVRSQPPPVAQTESNIVYQQRNEQPLQQRNEQPLQQRNEQPPQQRNEQPLQPRNEQPLKQRNEQPLQQRNEQPLQQRSEQPQQQRSEQPPQPRKEVFESNNLSSVSTDNVSKAKEKETRVELDELNDNDNDVNDDYDEEKSEEDIDEPKNDIPSFWTACPYCYHMFEYPDVYVDCTLRCQNCKMAFQAVPISSPPPIVDGKEAYFCCWGFLPLGFSVSQWEKNRDQAASWSPFSPMFSFSGKNEAAGGHVFHSVGGQGTGNNHSGFGGRKPSSKIIVDDEVYIELSDSSDESDVDWRNPNKKKKVKKTRGRPPMKHQADNGKNVNDNNGRDNFQDARLPTEIRKKGVASNLRRHSGKIAKDHGKLDLNVEFSNEVEEAPPGMRGQVDGSERGEDDGIEGNGFFEGLDEFLSSLPILNGVGDEKVKAA